MRHLMQGITSGRVQVLGIAAQVSPAARLPEPWTLSWSDGAWTWAGTGVSTALRAPGHVELMEAVARSEVVTEGGDARPPAPWFGGFAFDATAPRRVFRSGETPRQTDCCDPDLPGRSCRVRPRKAAIVTIVSKAGLKIILVIAA